MLPRADLNTTRAPASIEAPTPVLPSKDARQEVSERLAQIAIGRQVRAEVLALFEDGTSLVRVENATARMLLPAGAKVGDQLSMAFVAREPRPTFLLLPQEGDSTPASLSSAGRLVSQLMQQARDAGAPTAIQPRTPLLSTPAASLNTETVAGALYQSVELSGLFYESHMQEWISGSRSLTDLQREPQASLPPPPSNPQTHSPLKDLGHADLTKLVADMKEIGNGASVLAKLISDAQSQSQASNAPSVDAAVIARPESPLPAIQPEAAQIINQQLNTLEQQRIQWQGELWPGQRMEWEITEDSPQGRSGETPEPSWSSKVRFHLPTLGEISATVKLTGDRVHVQVDTADDKAANTLRTERPALAEALAAAGSPMESFLVKRHESP
jgi:hypothetical protein